MTTNLAKVGRNHFVSTGDAFDYKTKSFECN